MVMFLLRWENLTSISFLGLRERCQYRHVPTGFGSTTPAVNTAWKSPLQLTRRVISLMRTGARRLDRSRLCTHKKLISTIFTVLSYTLMVAGTALMNPNSLLFFVTLTPTCQSLSEPGG